LSFWEFINSLIFNITTKPARLSTLTYGEYFALTFTPYSFFFQLNFFIFLGIAPLWLLMVKAYKWMFLQLFINIVYTIFILMAMWDFTIRMVYVNNFFFSIILIMYIYAFTFAFIKSIKMGAGMYVKKTVHILLLILPVLYGCFSIYQMIYGVNTKNLITPIKEEMAERIAIKSVDGLHSVERIPYDVYPNLDKDYVMDNQEYFTVILRRNDELCKKLYIDIDKYGEITDKHRDTSECMK
jgi:hypothetical protein